jgi:hypothetical protein
MKKQLFLFAIILMLFTGLAMAQEDKHHNKVGGIRAGWQNAGFFLDGSKYPGSEAYQTFYLGFFRDNKLAPMFYHGSGLDYFQTGIQMGGEKDRLLHYISLPNYLKFKLGPAFLLGGVAPSFKVAEKVNVGGENVNPLDANKSNWFDIPAFAGVGVKILFITVEARYHWGLVKLNDDGYMNQYFQLGAGLSF